MSNDELQDSNRNYSATSLEKMIETYRTGVKRSRFVQQIDLLLLGRSVVILADPQLLCRINSEDEFLRLLNKIPSAHNLMGYGTGQNVQQVSL